MVNGSIYSLVFQPLLKNIYAKTVILLFGVDILRHKINNYLFWFVFGLFLYCISISGLSLFSNNNGGLKVGYADVSVQECGCSKCHMIELEGCDGCHTAKRVRNDLDDSPEEHNDSEDFGNDNETNNSDSGESNYGNSNTSNKNELGKTNSSIISRKSKQNENMK